MKPFQRFFFNFRPTRAMTTNPTYPDISTSRNRISRRAAVYENDDEPESEASGMELAEKDIDSGQLYQDSKSSVSSADVTPFQSRSDNHGMPDSMLIPLEQSSMLELSDDQKNIFNKLDASNSVVDAAMRYLQESISEEKRIKDLANSANRGYYYYVILDCLT